MPTAASPFSCLSTFLICTSLTRCRRKWRAGKGISRYDAQLEYVDQVMGHFQQELMQSGWWEKSLVVLFGDHGEGLGDHQETDHGYYIYESTLHVPLIVHWPR